MDSICINGERITPANLHEWSSGKIGILADLATFLQEWFSPTDTVTLQTSGSTGTPKSMQASKTSMRASAEATCRFFGLQAGHTALLCLPLRYIAGKMMVVRAIVGKLNLFVQEPSSTPLIDNCEIIDFAPLVPMQVHSLLQQPHGMQALQRVRNILLGGGFIQTETEAALQQCPSAIFASYGMTETLSHIALRRVNGPEASAFYTPLPGVSITLTQRDTLALSAPFIGVDYLETNDMAELTPNGTFRILGRVDNVINSGGVKIQAEEIEQSITRTTGLQVLALPIPHPRLGQAVGLLWEGPEDALSRLQQAIEHLPRYHRPAAILHAPIPLTATGKPDRPKARGMFEC